MKLYVAPHIEKIINRLWVYRKDLDQWGSGYFPLEYPRSGGLPISLRRYLSNDALRFLQRNLKHALTSKTKTQFAKRLIPVLSNHSILVK